MNKKIILALLGAIIVLLAVAGCSSDFTGVTAEANTPAAADAQTRSVDPTATFAEEVTSGPLRDTRWVNSTATNLDILLLNKKIVAYTIQWSTTSWSAWFVPGVNDLYQKPGEPVRRAWACFNDHTFKYIAVPAGYAGSLRTYNEFNNGTIPSGIGASGVGFYSFGPSWNTAWVNNLSINIDLSIDRKKIVAYKVTWSAGSKSGWFVPGYSDIYQKEGEPARRWWACFNDHSHEYLAFVALC